MSIYKHQGHLLFFSLFIFHNFVMLLIEILLSLEIMNSKKNKIHLLFAAIVVIAGVVVSFFLFRSIWFYRFYKYGEQLREENAIWEAEHPDTLVLSPPIVPTFANNYDSLTDNNFRAFVDDWKNWSNQLRTCSNDSLVNRVVQMIFTEYTENRPDSIAMYSLPDCIEVRNYSGAFDDNPYDNYGGSWDKKRYWEYMMKASDRFAYVPSFDSDKEIVYITTEIKRIISQFIGGVCESEEDDILDYSKWSEINEDRLSELSRLIQVEQGHWGGHWHLCSMPIIHRLFLYDDGFVASLRTSYCAGETVFIPYDKTKEKVTISSWVE